MTFNWGMTKLAEFQGAVQSDLETGEHLERKSKKLQTGFLAQEVESAARECGFDFSGLVTPANPQSHYELVYADFVVPLVKAIQEQQTLTFPDDTQGVMATDLEGTGLGYSERRTRQGIDVLLWRERVGCTLYDPALVDAEYPGPNAGRTGSTPPSPAWKMSEL